MRTHYDAYVKGCKEAKISPHHWAEPRKLKKDREAKEKKEAAEGKGTLNAKGFKPLPLFRGPEKFSKELALENIAKFIVATDQVSR